MEVFGPTSAEGLIENLDGIVGAIGLRAKRSLDFASVLPAGFRRNQDNQQSAINNQQFSLRASALPW